MLAFNARVGDGFFLKYLFVVAKTLFVSLYDGFFLSFEISFPLFNFEYCLLTLIALDLTIQIYLYLYLIAVYRGCLFVSSIPSFVMEILHLLVGGSLFAFYHKTVSFLKSATFQVQCLMLQLLINWPIDIVKVLWVVWI